MKGFLFFFTAFAICNPVSAQPFFSPENYPGSSFRNPLSIPFAFVGNFGETRPDHFHSGLDIRTGGKENLPVYAIGDGYISRVKIEAGGFGNAIYITHASGYTSVYAHLNQFFPALENFIRKKQYQQKSWKTDITFFPDQFWVRQGTFIAWSGNTGSSQGPHLHFEIRNGKTESPLNPLLFFDGITDDKRPAITQLAVYDAGKSIYEQSPVIYALNKGKLRNDTILTGSGQIFFGIHADDYMPMGAGTLGVFEMHLYVDDKAVFGWQMDNISYDLTRFVNALADYKTRKVKGLTLQLCRQLPNDRLPVYRSFNGSKGVIDLSDGDLHKIMIEVIDTRNNAASLTFYVQGSLKNTRTVCTQEMVAGKKNYFKNEYFSISLEEDALYDNICFKSSSGNSTNPYSHLYKIHSAYVPLQSPAKLLLNPKQPVSEALRQKIAVVNVQTKKGSAARMINQQVAADITKFGDYEIVTDVKGPVISSSVKDGMNIGKSKALYFTVKEETTSVRNCIATVEGQWLRLVQKGNTYYYEVDEYFPSGTHQLTISATDENDNTSTRSYKLTR